MKKYLIIICVICANCSSSTENKTEIDTKVSDGKGLEGTWTNLSIIVRMPDSTLLVEPDQWEDKLGIKPIVTTFVSDGSFRSEYRSPEDSLLMTSTGTWTVDRDSLHMSEHGQLNTYYYQLDGDTVVFMGMLDWDQDGRANDHYAGKQVRTKN